jgi:hypothetical protein
MHTSKHPCITKRGREPAAATPHGAEPGLAHDSGRRAPASVHTWTGVGGGLPATATQRGAITGLARDSGRRAPASDCTKREGGWPTATTPRGATRPRWEARTDQHVPGADTPCGAVPGLAHNGGGARTDKIAAGTQPRRWQSRGQTAHTMPLLGPTKRERIRRKSACCPTAGSPAAKLRAPLPCTTIPSQHCRGRPNCHGRSRSGQPSRGSRPKTACPDQPRPLV